ncbi:hypothetical protein CEUSTIGMA_g4650.t1 [Chlamydomonas eustigma]|uniref:Peptidase M16 N-terminal domain-containing protein n=1 Tax=Chlamydomonas eustigma TaxID=1157962 RepID=A0A250X280_9CHLO|nr:hypothetical protein CEUSTIGMA_g4650.t1 [Chlamydomonas eustigma]|eukprot:GAX77204.1 hypothetical protein CEUSTIGMA_g4650.t1 [Chlamydomonas eustigma]
MVAIGLQNPARFQPHKDIYVNKSSQCMSTCRPRNDRGVTNVVCSSVTSLLGGNAKRILSRRSTRALSKLSHASSAAFGHALMPQASSTASQRRTSRPSYIHGSISRRGGSVIICAALVEQATVESEESMSNISVEELLNIEVEKEKNLVTGQLSNGLRYVILPNKLPPTRFEAHLEVHAGSVDEGPNEQGIAHFVEHVTFLGSKKREGLLGTGARANAYTDFHHTVFHVHAPITNNNTGTKMLPQVLEALEEIAFRPEFLNTRIEKERKAVLAEAQMMNTIEYRVDCQLLQYLHEENNLGYRFPIGKTEQVKQWPGDALRTFWGRWYFPANATLYIVGDLDRDVEDVETLIEKTFGRVPAGMLPEGSASKEQSVESAVLGDGNVAMSLHHDSGSNGNGMNGKGQDKAGPPPAVAVVPGTNLKQRHDVRPPVKHRFGYGPIDPAEPPVSVNIFRHPLLHHFSLSIFCKLPILSMTKMEHLRQSLMMRLILSVFQFRVHGRYMSSTPSFHSIELDISDSGREGCAVSTLTITSDPDKWKDAIAVAVQEVRRLQRHGVTRGEFQRYLEAILRDSSQLAESANKIPSVDTLNFVMESLACGHTVMGHRDAHEAMSMVADTITLEDLNAIARSMLSFASDFGTEAEVLEAARLAPSDHFAHLGPTRATSLIACIPAYVDASGSSVAGSGGSGRSGSMGAAGHIDADTIDLAELEKESQALDEFEVPDGAIKYDLSPAEIAAAIANQELDVAAPDDVETPEHLMSEEEVQALVQQRRPAFVPLAGEGAADAATPPTDSFSGVTQRRLSNGIRINYRYSDNEPRAAMMRVIANGGRAAEKLEVGPDGFGAVIIGTRALSEVGCVGDWPREQTEAFCVSNLINCALEGDEENIIMDFHFAIGEADEEGSSGLQKVFELLHLFLENPRWEASAMERAKQAYLSSGRQVQKSLEKATADRILDAMMGAGRQRRFREPTPEEVEALTMEGMEKSVRGLLHAGNLEINIVGDFNPEELEQCLLRYIGTVRPRPQELCSPLLHVGQNILSPPLEQRHTVWHLKDSDERACSYVAGAAPLRWGPYGSYEPLSSLPSVNGDIQAPPIFVQITASAAEKAKAAEMRRNHPLYQGVTLMLFSEIVNSRLFTTVRDTLGLTYDVSFEVTMFDRVRVGWWSVHVTSHPDKIYDALNASIAVMRDIAISPINRREVSRARTTLLTRHESELKDNLYWLGLMTHLQNDHVPLKRVECLRDLKTMFEAATVEDIYHLYNHFNFDDNNLFTCVGISGKSAPPVPENYLAGAAAFSLSDDVEEMLAATAPSSLSPSGFKWPQQAGISQLQQPQQHSGPEQILPNPAAMLTALIAAAQSMNIKGAMSQSSAEETGKK